MTAGVDEVTAGLVLALPVVDENDAVRWLAVVDNALELTDPPDWAAFETQVRELAASEGFDTGAVTKFLELTAANGQFESVTRLRALGDQLPGLLTELRQAGDGSPLDWVTDAQQALLTGQWGSDWATYLVTDLADRWGDDWQLHPADHKVSWLDDLLESGAYSSAGQFDWVPAELWPALEGVWGAAWQDPLSERLTQVWGPGWEEHPGEHKSAWLADMVARGELAEAAETPERPQDAAFDEFLAAVRELPDAGTLTEAQLVEIAIGVRENAGS